MGQSLDPYHKWLGIPPEEQPPNHYRLLGIPLFESDPDVIEAAADQRMIHLRRYQSGQHVQWSQRLLNEVSAARVCLLNVEKRTAYDAELRRSLAAPPPVAPPPVEPDVAPPPILPFPVVEEWSPRVARRRLERMGVRKKSNSLGPIISAVIAGVMLLVVLIAWQIALRGATSSSSEHKAKPAASSTR